MPCQKRQGQDRSKRPAPQKHVHDELIRGKQMQRHLEAINRRWPLGVQPAKQLTPSELRWIAKWASPGEVKTAGEGERKALYRILKKLELESKAQLLALLNELRPD